MKFYKVMNDDTTVAGMQFHTGLNIYPGKYSTRGNFKDNGIFYAREDIFSLLRVGSTHFREVEIPYYALEVENDVDHPKIWKSDIVILGERLDFNIDTVQALVDEGADIHAGGETLLKFVAFQGDESIAKYCILQGADIHINNEGPLRIASSCNNDAIVRLLIEYGSNLHANHDCIVCNAISFGNISLVNYLIDHGADMNIVTTKGYQGAVAKGNANMIDYIDGLRSQSEQ